MSIINFFVDLAIEAVAFCGRHRRVTLALLVFTVFFQGLDALKSTLDSATDQVKQRTVTIERVLEEAQ